MNKQYFYSYHIIKNGVQFKFGHGSVIEENESDDAYALVLAAVDCPKDCQLHLIAFNRIN